MNAKPRHEDIQIRAGTHWLDGTLCLRTAPAGLVVVVERSGSTLKTSRGAFISDAIAAAGFATLQVALLAHEEERRSAETWRHPHSLAPRIMAVLEWIGTQQTLKNLPLGMLARDDATASMIRVAARGTTALRAIASRAGRPDLAGIEALRTLEIPLLLVVGELDHEVLARNKQAIAFLSGPKELAVIAGASHAFEELGALEHASRTIADWFRRWLGQAEA